MAIQTSVAPRQTIRLVAMAVICAALGLWGAYDYFIKIPRNAAAAERYQALGGEALGIAERVARGEGTLADVERAGAIEDELETFGGKVPEPPGKYDRAINLWVYIVGCGVIGIVWSLWALWSLARRKYRLDDDGTLHHPGGTWPASEITGIDMTRWMEKSLATLQRTQAAAADESLLLDDYKYRNMHLIVGHFASRFHPDDWTAEARMVRREATTQTDADATGPEAGPGEAAAPAGAETPGDRR
ncbi:MAG TPA: hypothetical protein PKC43_09120 [Phycisphaerales bacterium]|mgnify:CR=1 FL=1|nr:hypothetical protein [Phycisphaerales bacterium]HMP37596.1 hypothetical protein [Phycisphaerales bacterium]